MTTPIRKLLEDLEVAAQSASDEGATSDDDRNLARVRGHVLAALDSMLAPDPPPEWLVRVGPTLRGAWIFYRGEKVKRVRSLRLESSFGDATVLTLTVYALDGVTIEGAEGLPVDIEQIAKVLAPADFSCPGRTGGLPHEPEFKPGDDWATCHHCGDSGFPVSDEAAGKPYTTEGGE